MGHRFTISRNSNIELTIIVFIIFLFIALAMIKIIPVFGKVERTYFENTLKQIELIINVHASTQLLKGQPEGLLMLVNGNPFSLVKKKHLPAGYIGELASPNYDNISGYQWFFDKTDNTLVYIVENKRYFLSSGPGSPHIKFKLSLKFADKEKNGVYNKGIDEIQGLELTPQNSYEWLDKPV